MTWQQAISRFCSRNVIGEMTETGRDDLNMSTRLGPATVRIGERFRQFG